MEAVVDGADVFAKQLKAENAVLGLQDGAATDVNANKAIEIADVAGDKGASDLKSLNKSVSELLIAANKIVNDTIKELKTPTKREAISKP